MLAGLVKFLGTLAVFAGLSGTVLPAPAIAQADADAATLERGQYVFRAAGCGGCHTDVDNKGELLAGGRALVTPLGTFYTPNITPDRTYGIGGWSDGDFIRAIKAGIAPDGRRYFPAFPYTSYAKMGREDVVALKAYLDGVAPVAKPNRRHEVPFYLRLPGVMWVWRALYFEPELRVPARSDEQLRRGAYLVEALAHCGECHTPRDALGGSRLDMRLAGNGEGPEGEAIPNITPDRKTGIGRWTRGDLVTYFQIGMAPDGDFAGSLMAEVIDNGLSKLTKDDLNAIAAYLQSVPSIEHDVSGNRGKKQQGSEFD